MVTIAAKDADFASLETPRVSKWVAQAAMISFWLVLMSFINSLDPPGVPFRWTRNLLLVLSLKLSSICSDCKHSFLASRWFSLNRTFFLSEFFFSSRLSDSGRPAFLHSLQLDLHRCSRC